MTFKITLLYGKKMEKKLLLSLLFILQIGLIQSGDFLPNAKHYFQNQNCSNPEFIASTERLEREKAVLLSTIKENDTKIERLKSRIEGNYHCVGHYHHGCCHHSTTGEHFLGSLIAFVLITALQSSEMRQISALEKEQVKNKAEVTRIEESLETVYFEQLDSTWKTKFLQSKIEAYASESAKITNEIPALENPAAKKSLYSRLSLASGITFGASCVSLAFVKSNNQPYVAAAILASFLSTVGFLTKAGESTEAHTKLEDIKNKLALFKKKSAQHSTDLDKVTAN